MEQSDEMLKKRNKNSKQNEDKDRQESTVRISSGSKILKIHIN